MTINVDGLSWFGFWIFLVVMAVLSHRQYMAGHDTMFFTHKTDAEKRLRDAAVKAAEGNS